MFLQLSLISAGCRRFFLELYDQKIFKKRYNVKRKNSQRRLELLSE
jgi:hypothetical protein